MRHLQSCYILTKPLILILFCLSLCLVVCGQNRVGIIISIPNLQLEKVSTPPFSAKVVLTTILGIPNGLLGNA